MYNMKTKLWRLDPTTGYWRIAQGPFQHADNADAYLQLFQKGEPKVTFKLSVNRPPYPKNPLL